MMEQVVRNKSSLLLNIQNQKKQKLQPFTINIKTEIIYKDYLKCQAGRLGCRDKVV